MIDQVRGPLLPFCARLAATAVLLVPTALIEFGSWSATPAGTVCAAVVALLSLLLLQSIWSGYTCVDQAGIAQTGLRVRSVCWGRVAQLIIVVPQARLLQPWRMELYTVDPRRRHVFYVADERVVFSAANRLGIPLLKMLSGETTQAFAVRVSAESANGDQASPPTT